MLNVKLIIVLMILMNVSACATSTTKIHDFCFLFQSQIYNYNSCDEPTSQRIDNLNEYYEELCK